MIANARDALGQAGTGAKAGAGGRIILKTAFRAGVRKRLGNGSTQKLPIELLIRDNGPGIAPGIQKNIFQPFVTSKANGQGLGLALVAKIVEDHNGIITVKSKPGKTVVSILLPVEKSVEKR